jgi:small-conductance mechanosensitive channel
MVYWFSTTIRNHEHKLAIIETSYFMSLDITPEHTERLLESYGYS